MQDLNVRLAATNTESVGSVTTGLSSCPCAPSSSARSHNSRQVSLLKSMSTAPDVVPVAIHGAAEPDDQANEAVRGISRRRPRLPARVEFQRRRKRRAEH